MNIPPPVIKRLAAAEFISHPADVSYFDQLVCEIRRLERPSDRLDLSTDYRSAGAWQRAYTIYLRLQHREKATPLADAEPAFRRINEDWNRYVHQRLDLLNLARSGLVDEDTCLYLGLRPGDLDNPVIGLGGERHREWPSRAVRLAEAIGTFESMTPGQKMAIPQIMAARRAEAATKKLARRVAELEEAQP